MLQHLLSILLAIGAGLASLSANAQVGPYPWLPEEYGCNGIWSPAPKPTVHVPVNLLEKKIYAVHSTRFFPEGRLIKAGGADRGFRPTLHFSLGMMVQPHTDGNWDRKAYAILVPLKDLVPQLLNVMAHDTITVGNFLIPQDGILVLPADDPTPIPEGLRVFRYSGEVRQGVHDALESVGAWRIKGKPDQGLMNDTNYLEGTTFNINTPEAFQEFLKKYPGVTFNDATVHPSITLDHWLLMNFSDFYRDRGIQLSDSRFFFELDMVETVYRHFLETLHESRFSVAVAESVQGALQQFQQHLNLLRTEARLRRSMGLSVLAVTDRKFVEKVIPLRDDTEVLYQFLAADPSKLQEVTRSPEAGPLGWEWQMQLAHLRPSEFESMLERHAAYLTVNLTADELRTQYILDRFQHLGIDAAKKEGLHLRIPSSLIESLRQFAQSDDVWALSHVLYPIPLLVRRYLFLETDLHEVFEPFYELQYFYRCQRINGDVVRHAKEARQAR